jgi:hypothetical protein
MANQYKVSGQIGTLLNYRRIRFACGPRITEMKWSTKDLIDTDEWVISNIVDMEDDCKTAGNIQWSFIYGTYISGAAYMYNLVRQYLV